MEVKHGFKQAEVGVIPEDWSVTPLGRLISSVEYGSSAKSKPVGDTPVLRMGNLQGGKLDWEDLVFSDDESEIRKYTLHSGDVLFNRTNTIDLVGKTAIYKGERPAIFAGYLIRIKADKTALDSRFLNYVLNAEFSRKHSAKVLSVAVGQANINGQKLKTYPIPLPPTKPEQEVIADALSDADAVIDSLEQLAAKRRHLKQGAMQELLTGRKRLPGFTGKWEVKRLDDCLLGRPEYGINAPAVQYSDLLPAYIRITDISQYGRFESNPRVSVKAASAQQYFLSEGDLVFARTGASVGKSYRYDGRDGPLVFAGFLIRVRPNPEKLLPAFLGAFATTTPYWNWVRLMSMRSGQPGINGNEYAQLPIRMPEVAEQLAITTILSDMDAEIAAIERKLAKARQVKQGMMQDLLTGRIRLI